MMLMQQLGLGGGFGGGKGGMGGMHGMHPLLLSSLLGGGCVEPDDDCTTPNQGNDLCGNELTPSVPPVKVCCVC